MPSAETTPLLAGAKDEENSSASVTRLERIPELIQHVRQTFQSGKTRSLQWRENQLRQLARMLETEEAAIVEALRKDLSRCKAESIMADILPVLNECAHSITHLSEWAAPKKAKDVPMAFSGDTVETRYYPRGVVLIIGTWNYPVQLVLSPLVAALSAGNAAILKLSEISAHTASLLAKLVPKYMDTDAIKVVTGGPEASTELLKHQFDYICFTGSTRVGKIVHQAAAKFLTPTLLELGGKCPVIVDENVDPMIAAKRIYWAKFINAGQTCIAPDYILVHKNLKDKLLDAFKTMPKEFFGSPEPQECEEYTHIVSDGHFKRLEEMLQKQLSIKGTRIVTGGQKNSATRFFAPTVLDGVGMDVKVHSVMTDEIFGPILPVISIDSIQQGIDYVQSKPHPLAIFPFSSKKETLEHILDSVEAGNALANDFFVSMGMDIPFGGVGESGMGAYHGHAGFLNFSQSRGTMIRSPTKEYMNSIRYPALFYKKDWVLSLTRRLLINPIPSPWRLRLNDLTRPFMSVLVPILNMAGLVFVLFFNLVGIKRG